MKVIVVGGGFAGIETMKSLVRQKGVEPILFSDKSYFEYYPALYRIVTGASPIEVCIPVSDLIPKENFVNEKISKINPELKEVETESGKKYSYDKLILALGSETAYFNLPGIENLAFGFKSVREATKLKNHISSLFEEHEHPTKNELVSHFHIVIVGGGPTGVEVAGDLATHMKRLAHKYRVHESFITIDLIESGNRLLKTLPEKVSAKVLKRLRKLGINVFLNREMISEEIEQVFLKDMSLKAKTVIWCAGASINRLYNQIPGIILDGRKVKVDSILQAEGLKDVFVIGDGASTPFSGLAQTAIYDGEFVASNIKREVSGKKMIAYKPKKTAFAIPVGVDWGVLSYRKFAMFGLPAYLVRHLIDFIFFSGWLKPAKLFGVFIEGWKYRRIK